jgi:hypothetical protein
VATVQAEKVLLTVKNSTSFFGYTNRVKLGMELVSMACDGNQPARVNIYRDCTLSTSANFISWSSNISPMVYDTSSTSFSGGRLLFSFFLSKSDAKEFDFVDHDIYLNNGQTVSITMASSANTSGYVAMNMVNIF